MSESVTIHRQEVPQNTAGDESTPSFLAMIKDLELRPVYTWMTTNLNKEYTVEIRRSPGSVDTVIVCNDPHDAMMLQITHGISNAVL